MEGDLIEDSLCSVLPYHIVNGVKDGAEVINLNRAPSGLEVFAVIEYWTLFSPAVLYGIKHNNLKSLFGSAFGWDWLIHLGISHGRFPFVGVRVMK